MFTRSNKISTVVSPHVASLMVTYVLKVSHDTYGVLLFLRYARKTVITSFDLYCSCHLVNPLL